MRQKTFGWSTVPEPGHYVQFYQSESNLLAQLSRFVVDGLHTDETCLVVATKEHLKRLDNLMGKYGVDVHALQKRGQYVPLDADEMLDNFMNDERPDKDRFRKTMGSFVRQASKRGKPLRIYGEMVALLWQDGNKDAVILLENLWNELVETYSCNLFCAYPELHFIYDRGVREEIASCHRLALQSFATN